MEDVNAQLRRLDMNHGFVRYIQKNQFDRDEYHKVMEERKAEVQEKIRESRTSKTKKGSPTESRVYIPPHRRSRRRSEREENRHFDKKQSSSVMSETEETTMRRKARSRAKKELDNINDLGIIGGSSGSTSNSVKQIFTLNMKNNEGEEIEIPVLSTDKAASLAKQIGKRYNFSEEQCRNLRLTLDKALEQYLDCK